MSYNHSDISNTHDIDLHSPDFIANPFPAYRWLLKHAPVYQASATGDYFVARPAYIEAIMRDNRTFLSDRTASFSSRLSEPQRDQIQPLLDSLARWLLFQDPPKHMPLRKIINAALNPKLVNHMAADIRAITRQLLSTMLAQGQDDLVQGLSYPLPALVIARLLGVPAEDIHLVKQWSDDIASFTGSRTGFDVAQRAQASVLDMSLYLQRLLHDHANTEKPPLLDNLLQFQQQHPEFTEQDLLANCILLLFAGHETTTCLINNLWIQLQAHDDQRQALISHPQLIDNAVEEGLRFDGAVHRLGRFIQADCEIGGVRLRKGRMAYLLLGAANRSEELFNQPDTFDIRRKPVRHVGFGFGPHLCSGAALARLETAIAIAELLQQLPEGKVQTPPEYHMNLALHAVKALKIII